MTIAMSVRTERGAMERSLSASADAIADDVFIRSGPFIGQNLIGRAPEDPLFQKKHRHIKGDISVLSVGTISKNMEPFLKDMEPLERARYYVLNKVSSGYNEAFETFSEPSIVNTPVAQFFLGMIYYHGLGKPRNPERAFKCMSASYAGENLNAAYYLGMMYLKGMGTKQIPKMAMKYLKEAANTVGDNRAELQVGLLYLGEYGYSETDAVKAFNWIKKAAIHSNVEAKFILGQLYRGGCGCDVDKDSAFRYIESAAKAGHKGAQIFLGNMYLKGEGVRASKSMASYWHDVADGKKSLS